MSRVHLYTYRYIEVNHILYNYIYIHTYDYLHLRIISINQFRIILSRCKASICWAFSNARLQDAYAAAQKSLEQRLDQYRFSYEALQFLKAYYLYDMYIYTHHVTLTIIVNLQSIYMYSFDIIEYNII